MPLHHKPAPGIYPRFARAGAALAAGILLVPVAAGCKPKSERDCPPVVTASATANVGLEEIIAGREPAASPMPGGSGEFVWINECGYPIPAQTAETPLPPPAGR